MEDSEYFKRYSPDKIDWQVKDKSWVNLVRAIGDSGKEEDFTLESFKAFFEGMLNHYCSHFQTAHFDTLFQTKLDTFNELKQQLEDKAAFVSSEQA